jgi:hypothetical protein
MESTTLGKQDRGRHNPPRQSREGRHVLPRPGALKRRTVRDEFDGIVPERLKIVGIGIGRPEAEAHDGRPLHVVRL